jgi:VanZ family protein
MPLLFYRAADDRSPPQLWNTVRAAAYGAAIGVLAAAFKLFAPWREPHSAAANVRELVGAALAFALLCAFAAALRNVLARRLIWRDGP